MPDISGTIGTIAKIFDVNNTKIRSGDVRVPDPYTDKIYEYTEKEVDISLPGSLKYRTVLGPFDTYKS